MQTAHFHMEAHGKPARQLSEIRTAVCASGSRCRSAVKRCRPQWGGKAPPLRYLRKTDRPPCMISPTCWGKRYLLFFERVPNVPGKTFADFSAFYSFLSNGQFCPLAYTGKRSKGDDLSPPCIERLPTRTFLTGLEVPDLDSAAVTRRKIARNEIGERNCQRLYLPTIGR